MEQGRENGWEPNGDIYELLINWLCTTATSAPKAIAQCRQDIAGVAVITDVEHARPPQKRCCSAASRLHYTHCLLTVWPWSWLHWPFLRGACAGRCCSTSDCQVVTLRLHVPVYAHSLLHLRTGERHPACPQAPPIG